MQNLLTEVTIFSFFNSEIFLFFSEFYLLVFIIFLILVCAILSDSNLYFKIKSTLFGIYLTIFFLINFFFILFNSYNTFDIFSSIFLFEQNNYILILKLILTLSILFCFFMSISYFKNEKIEIYEFSILLLLSFLGIFFLLSSNDLLSFYLSIELQSLSFYILASLKKETSLSTEAGLTYFILGAISSGFLLLGFSFIFGFTGLTNFKDLNTFGVLKEISFYELENFENVELFSNNSTLIKNNNFLLILGIFFSLIAIFFKLGIFPFHFWIPNVYEGVPSIVTAIFSIMPKLAIFVILIKFYSEYFINFLISEILIKIPNDFLSFDIYYLNILLILSIFSIIFGSLGGLFQTKIKRLFAYSAISHVGFLGVAISINTFNGYVAFFFYLIIYLLLNFNFFFIYLNLRNFNNFMKLKKISDLKNLTKFNSILGIFFALNLFSMGGIPPLAGFFSKFLIFSSLLNESFFFVGGFIILLSVLSCFYYLRLIKIIYFSTIKKPLILKQISYLDSIFISITSLINILFILNPNFFLEISYLLTEYYLNTYFEFNFISFIYYLN